MRDELPYESVVAETTVPAGRSPSTAVVELVSTVTDTPPLDLPPLCRAIETDALDLLFSTADAEGVLTFRYHGYAVYVTADRRVAVCEANDPIPI